MDTHGQLAGVNLQRPGCTITGDAIITDDAGELGWSRADPEIHISVELVKALSDRDREFLEAMYHVGATCPHHPSTLHARRHDRDTAQDHESTVSHDLEIR